MRPIAQADGETPRLRVLALCSYPVEAAATRFRIERLAGPLAARGIHVDVRPFVDSRTFSRIYDRRQWVWSAAGIVRGAVRRVADFANAGHYDVLLVQREAAFFGPPLLESALAALRHLPMVLDLDDATWVAYDSPTYGRLARILKPSSKADRLIRRATVVACGSRAIARHVESLGTRPVLVPTVVDLAEFRPRDQPVGAGPTSAGAARYSRASARSTLPLVGWIGSHSTFPAVEAILPALGSAARKNPFRLLVVGHGAFPVTVDGIDVESRPWSLDRDARDFRSLDIGLYPLLPSAYTEGKSGLKAVQYMSCGVPFVASPVGEMNAIGEVGTTHLVASNEDEWSDALGVLLSGASLRARMGRAGRAWAESHFGTDRAAELLAGAIRQAAAL